MKTKASPRIAIYARYSSDLQNPLSVDDQIRLCQQLIRTHFPTAIHPARIYSDAAISGATMERPGLKQLLRDAQAGHFDVVVAEDLSRLSRSLKDIATVHHMLHHSRVDMFTGLEGRVTELHVGLKGTMNALFLADLAAKVRRGQAARIAAGFSPGGGVYGYRVVRGLVDDRRRNINGVREIDPEQAAVIRRVYEEYAAGKVVVEIVEGLNRDGIPSPSGKLWRRNSLLDGVKKQQGLLRNEIYLGRLVFNRSYTVRDPVTNRKRQIYNPEAEWTRVEAPHLRIIDDDLWQAVRVRDRQRVVSRAVERATPGKTRKKRKLGEGINNYNQKALTGYVFCGACGGIKNIAHQTRYLCSNNRYTKTCANARGTKEGEVYAALYEALDERITDGGPSFRPLLLAAFARDLEVATALRDQEQKLDGSIDRLLTAIEKGVDSDKAMARIVPLQKELTRLRAELALLAPIAVPDEPTIRTAMLRELDATRRADDLERTRRMLKALVRRITLTPITSQRSGEDITITLRDDGWPDFWRIVCASHKL